MNVTRQLHDLGQSIWLHNITRALLTGGTLSRYSRDFAVAGLTSYPTIFDYAVKNCDFYDDAIRRQALRSSIVMILLMSNPLIRRYRRLRSRRS